MQVLVLALLGVFCLGWPVLLGFGIYRIRRKLAGGLLMTVLGGVWALPALALTALVGLAVYSYTTWETTEVVPFDAASYAGETGTIRIPFTGDVRLTVNRTNEQFELCGSDGLVVAPAGEMKPSRFEGRLQHEGEEWTTSAWLGRRNTTLTVSPEEGAELDVGPPFTATIHSKLRGDRQVALDFRLRGSGPEIYTIRGPKGRLPPRFELRDQQGQVVLSGKFAYG